MAIGNLNVSVTAETKAARTELAAMRFELKKLRAANDDVADSFGGNSIRDYERRFGGVKKEAKGAVEDLSSFRSAVVDLRKETSRYNGLEKMAQSANSLKGQMKALLEPLKTVAKTIGLVGAVGAAPFAFGRRIKNLIVDVKDLSTAWQQMKALVGAGKSVEEEEIERLAKRDEALERNIAKNEELAAANRAAEEARNAARAGANGEVDRGVAVHQYGEEQVRFAEEVAQFGADEALALREKRRILADLDARQEAAEAKAQARHQAELARIAAEQKAREAEAANRKTTEEKIAALRQELADKIAGVTDQQKARRELLDSINDPELKRQAAEAFDRNAAWDAGWARGEGQKNGGRRAAPDDPGYRGIQALDPLSREGYAQRVRSLGQGKLDKIAQEQLGEQRKIAAGIETLGRSSLVVKVK